MKRVISIMKAHYGALMVTLVVALSMFISFGLFFSIRSTYVDYNIPSVGMVEVVYSNNDKWYSIENITEVRYYKLTKNFVIHHRNYDGKMTKVKFSSKLPHSFFYTPGDNWQLEKWIIDGVI